MSRQRNDLWAYEQLVEGIVGGLVVSFIAIAVPWLAWWALHAAGVASPADLHLVGSGSLLGDEVRPLGQPLGVLLRAAVLFVLFSCAASILPAFLVVIGRRVTAAIQAHTRDTEYSDDDNQVAVVLLPPARYVVFLAVILLTATNYMVVQAALESLVPPSLSAWSPWRSGRPTGGSVMNYPRQFLPPEEAARITPWRAQLIRCRYSPDPRWRNAFPLGTHYKDPQHWFYLSWDHQWQGERTIARPGRGKTWRHLYKKAVAAIAAGDKTVIFLDMKGDLALLWACWHECHRAGIPFRWVSTLRKLDGQPTTSYVFNPVDDFIEGDYTPDEMASLLGSALSLVFERLYGQSFYGDIVQFLEMVLVRREITQGRNTFRYLARRILDGGALPLRMTVAEFEQFRSVLTQLSFLTNLNALPASRCNDPRYCCPVSDQAWRNRVRMADIANDDRPQFLYVFAPAGVSKMVATMTGQLVLGGLFQAMLSRSNSNRLKKLVISDESQHALSSRVIEFAMQIRARGISICAALQSSEQLRQGGDDRAALLDSYAAIHTDMSPATQEDVERVQFFAGEKLEASLSYKIPQPQNPDDPREYTLRDLPPEYYSGWPGSLFVSPPKNAPTVTLRAAPRWNRNEMLDIGAQPGLAFVCSTINVWPWIGRGLAKCLGFDFAMSQDEYAWFNSLPWPPPHPETVPVDGEDWLGAFIRENETGPVSGPRRPAQGTSPVDEARRKLRDEGNRRP